MTDPVRAPWTSEQVDALNRFQQAGRMHPFTCGSEHHETSPVLVAARSGWVCPEPACEYTQDWAHAFMLRPEAAAPFLLGAAELEEKPDLNVTRFTGDDLKAAEAIVDDQQPAPSASADMAAVLSVASAHEQLRSMALSLATCKGEIVDPRSFNAAIDAYGDAIRAEQTGVTVPREVLDGLIHVAAWVSRGRSAAFIGDEMLGNVYPDATARRALGAVDELGLRRMANETPPATCGRTVSVAKTEYPPCARPVGHPEAYCRSADDKTHFLALYGPRPADEAQQGEA